MIDNYFTSICRQSSPQNAVMIHIGQSNTQGYGSSAPVVGSFAKEMRSSAGTLVAVPQETGDVRGNFLSGHSLQNACCNTYNALTGKNIAQLKYTRGGTNSTQWASTAGLADEAIGYITPRMGLIPLATYPDRFLIIYQGESDIGEVPSTKPVFKNNWTTVIGKFRVLMGNDLVVFFVKPGYSTFAGTPLTDEIATAIDDLCLTVPKCYVGFDARPYNGLTYKNIDEIHYNQNGLNIIGSGVAQSIFNKIYA
jgi:hypothetical protein